MKPAPPTVGKEFNMSEDLLKFIIYLSGYICGSIGEHFSTKLFNKINKNK